LNQQTGTTSKYWQCKRNPETSRQEFLIFSFGGKIHGAGMACSLSKLAEKIDEPFCSSRSTSLRPFRSHSNRNEKDPFGDNRIFWKIAYPPLKGYHDNAVSADSLDRLRNHPDLIMTDLEMLMDGLNDRQSGNSSGQSISGSSGRHKHDRSNAVPAHRQYCLLLLSQCGHFSNWPLYCISMATTAQTVLLILCSIYQHQDTMFLYDSSVGIKAPETFRNEGLLLKSSAHLHCCIPGFRSDLESPFFQWPSFSSG